MKKTISLTILNLLAIVYFINARPISPAFDINVKSSNNNYDDSIGKIVKGKKEGVWIYYKKGVVTRTSYFKNDLLNGFTLIFHDKGMVWRTVPFVNGIVSGKVNFYNQDGEILAIYLYKHDLFVQTIMRKADPESPPSHDPTYYPLDDW